MFDFIKGDTVFQIAGFGLWGGGGVILQQGQLLLGGGLGNGYLGFCPTETCEVLNKYDLQVDGKMWQ